MNDHKLRAVLVANPVAEVVGAEYYEVGASEVTSIEWGSYSGHMAALPSVVVFKNGAIFSEHPFSNVIGVYYAQPANGETK